MIKMVYGLEYDGEILGLRLRFENGELYDIDIEAYKRVCNVGLDRLPTMELFEFDDDVLMTEDEYDYNQVIENASDNAKILTMLKDFMTGNRDKLMTQKEKEKRNRALTRLKNEYRSYFWDRGVLIQDLNDFVEFHYDYLSGHTNPYKGLTERQVQLIKMYFKWRSRIIYNENKKVNPILKVKPQKAEKLNRIMDGVHDWEFAGTIDTGYAGGGYCELGHALRYEQYAYSPSTQREIIFGSTCVADFFQVDKAVIDLINKTQDYISKEIRIIIYYYLTNKVDHYIKKMKYTELYTVLDHFKGRFNKFEYGSDWANFMGNFAKSGLPLTLSMVKEYDKWVKEMKKEKIIQEEERAKKVRVSKVKDFVNKLPQERREVMSEILTSGDSSDMGSYMGMEITYKDVQDHPFNNWLIDTAYILEERKNQLIQLSNGQFDECLKQLKRNKNLRAYYIDENNGRRLATLSEIRNKDMVYIDSYLSKEKQLALEILNKELTLEHFKYRGSDDDYNQSLSVRYQENLKYNLDGYKALRKWLESDEFMTDVQTLLRGRIEQPNDMVSCDKSSEGVDTSTLLGKYMFVVKNKDKLSKEDRGILERLSTQQREGSKDTPIVLRLFHQIQEELGNVNGNIDLDQGLESLDEIDNEEQELLELMKIDVDSDRWDKVKAYEKAYDLGLITRTRYVIDIVRTINSYGTISFRQLEHVNKGIEEMQDNLKKKFKGRLRG